MRHTPTPLLIATPLTLLVTACGSDTKDTDGATPARATTFVLDECSIVPPTDTISAGKPRVTATNKGKETHESVIVRASDAASLPTKPDGSVDEDKIPDSKKAGEISDIAAGKSVTKVNAFTVARAEAPAST